MLLVHPVQELVRALPALLAALVAGVHTGHGDVFSYGVSAVVILLGPLRWLTTSYRLTAARVELRKGIVLRQRTSVPLDRVRTADSSAHALHRALGLARLTIGTGQSERGRGGMLTLDGLDAGEAARLHIDLFPGATGAAETELVRSRPAWLRFAPFNLAGIVVFGMVVLFLPEVDIDPMSSGPVPSVLARLRGPHPWTGVAEAVAGLAAGCLLAGFAVSLFMFTNFRLARTPGNTLRVTYGLVTTRTTTIEERRVSGVKLSEHLVIRLLGGARAAVIATGLHTGGSTSLIVPAAPARDVGGVVARVLRDPAPATAALAGHGRRALFRRITRVVGPWLLVAVAFAVLVGAEVVPLWTWPLPAAALPLCLLLALDRYRGLGHALVDGHLVGRSGSLTRERWMLSGKAVIGFSMRRSFFQRRAGLATLVVSTPAGKRRYEIVDIAPDDAVRLAGRTVPGLLDPYLIQAD
nr:PH domain-containing protein [Streptomyces sp. SID11385]